MSKTLHADGNNGGHVYIYNGTFSEVADYESPSRADLSNLYFHSDLAYLACPLARVYEVSQTLPQINYNSNTSKFGNTSYTITNNHSDYVLINHGLGYTPIILPTMDGYELPAGLPVQTAGTSTRGVSIYADSTSIYLHSEAVTLNQSLPAITKTFKIYILNHLTSGSGTTAISATPTSFTAGFGKLSSDNKYLRRDTSNPDFYVTKARTADVSGGGLKIVAPNGSSIYESASYNGSFTGTTGTGVSV